MRACSEVGCDGAYLARSLCKAHYYRRKRAGTLPPRERSGYGFERTCSDPGCETTHFARGYCQRHYEQARAQGEGTLPCEVPGCGAFAISRGLCAPHVHRSRRYGLAPADLAALDEVTACEVCGGPALHVDHDHETGHVRGVLCRGCNTALGMVEDDRDRLAMLIHYLDRYTSSLP